MHACMQVATAATAGAAAGKGPVLGGAALSALSSTKLVDRVRYQALMLFRFLDSDKDGE